jgi:hypothetical protein
MRNEGVTGRAAASSLEALAWSSGLAARLLEGGEFPAAVVSALWEIQEEASLITAAGGDPRIRLLLAQELEALPRLVEEHGPSLGVHPLDGSLFRVEPPCEEGQEQGDQQDPCQQELPPRPSLGRVFRVERGLGLRGLNRGEEGHAHEP